MDLRAFYRFASPVTIAALIATLSCNAPLAAQQNPAPLTLTLQQALSVALEKNPERKAALANTKAASAGVEQARSNLLPHFVFDEIATRGDDPVYVFGTELRQQRFTAADFALSALNTPAPLGNFATRFGGTWNLFDSLASWRGMTRAERAEDAASHQLERADQEIVFRVIDSYYRVLLAAKISPSRSNRCRRRRPSRSKAATASRAAFQWNPML